VFFVWDSIVERGLFAMAAFATTITYPLPFFVCYVHPVTQYYESRTVQKAHLQS